MSTSAAPSSVALAISMMRSPVSGKGNAHASLVGARSRSTPARSPRGSAMTPLFAGLEAAEASIIRRLEGLPQLWPQLETAGQAKPHHAGGCLITQTPRTAERHLVAEQERKEAQGRRRVDLPQARRIATSVRELAAPDAPLGRRRCKEG